MAIAIIIIAIIVIALASIVCAIKIIDALKLSAMRKRNHASAVYWANVYRAERGMSEVR